MTPQSTTSSTPTPSSPANKGKFIFGSLCILIATIFWGVNIPVVKALVPEWMSADAVTAIRILGACVLFWLASIFVKTEKVQKPDWWRLIVGGAVGLFCFIYLLNLSLKYANPIDVSIIMTLPPVFVLVIGILFMHQKPKMEEIIGVLVSLAGAVIVILLGSDAKGGHKGADSILGDLIALASTICYSMYLVITEGPSHKYKPISILRWTFLFASIPALFLLPSLGEMHLLAAPAATPWLETAFILICPSFLAYFLLSPALKGIGSELVSLYQYLIPVFATIASVVMGLDKLQWVQVLAMIVIIVGMVFTNLGKRKRNMGK